MNTQGTSLRSSMLLPLLLGVAIVAMLAFAPTVIAERPQEPAAAVAVLREAAEPRDALPEDLRQTYADRIIRPSAARVLYESGPESFYVLPALGHSGDEEVCLLGTAPNYDLDAAGRVIETDVQSSLTCMPTREFAESGQVLFLGPLTETRGILLIPDGYDTVHDTGGEVYAIRDNIVLLEPLDTTFHKDTYRTVTVTGSGEALTLPVPDGAKLR